LSIRVVKALGVVLGLLGVGSWTDTAGAAGPPLLLGVSDCGELDEHEVRRLVAAELGAITVDEQTPDVTLVTVRCGGLRVTIRVHDPLSRKDVERSFDASPVAPRARPRWIALAAAELVLASWAELELNPKPRTEPEGPEATEALRVAAAAAVRKRAAAPKVVSMASGRPDPAPDLSRPARPVFEGTPGRTFRTVVFGSARSFLDDEGLMYGGGVRVGEERFTHMSWSADLLFESGSVSSGGVAYDVRSGTLGGWLLVYDRIEGATTFTGRAGVGIRMGLIGSQADTGGRASSAVAPWGWPMAALSGTIGRGFVAELSLEAGYVVLPVGGVAAGTTVGGTWCSLQLGFGTSFSAAAPRPRTSSR